MDALEECICRLKRISLTRSAATGAHVLLDKASSEFQTDAAQTTLRRSLDLCERDMLDEKIFRKILPGVHASLSKIIERIHDLMTNGSGINDSIIDETSKSLSTCEELLNLWQVCLKWISNIGKVPVNAVRSLLDVFPETIKVCFEHCKSSESVYGPLFGKLTRQLASLFRRANANLRLFLTTFENDVIVFDTDVQSETELLAKVVNAIGTAAVIANGMDLKTFVETMKSFGRLAFAFHQPINRVSPESVTVHIRSLARSASVVLSQIQKPDARTEDRAIKSVSLMARILEKLIAVYGSSANEDTFFSLVDLLARMYKCSPSCLRAPMRIEERTIEAVGSHISVAGAATPLLSTIIDGNVTQFKQAYFEYGSRLDVDKLGYHALTLAIMRKLIATYHRQQEWTVGPDSVVDVAFTNIDCLHEELCCGEVQLPVSTSSLGEQLRPIGIYEDTLMTICHLVANVSPSDFHVVELFLMKHLLSGRFWSSLLSLDVWSFVGRFGSAQLCESYVKYFMKIYATLEKQGDRVETVVLGNLIERLYSLLPSDTRHAIVRNLQRADFYSWIPLLRDLPDKSRSLLLGRLVSSSSIAAVFADLYDQSVSRHWSHLTKLFRAVGKLGCAEDIKAIDVFSKIWNLLASTIENYDERQVHTSAEMVSALLDIGRPYLPYDDAFLSMLHAAVAISVSVPSVIVIKMAFYMRRDVSSFNGCNHNEEGLESFDQIVNMCPDENLIRKMASAVMKKPPWVFQIVRAYMSTSQCCELQGYSNVQSYIRHMACCSENSATHICNSYHDSHKDVKYPRIEEDPDGSESFNLDQQVDKICDQLDQLLERKSVFSVDAVRKLRVALTKLTDYSYSSVESM